MKAAAKLKTAQQSESVPSCGKKLPWTVTLVRPLVGPERGVTLVNID